MSASSVVAANSAWRRLKRVLFLAMGFMFLFVLWHNERFIVDHSNPDWQFYFPVRFWLIPHGLAGLTALAAGPFQLSSTFRRRHLRVHRILGRFYVGGIVIAACVAAFMALTHTTVAIRFFALTLAASWLLATAVAFAAVRNGHIQVHRQWMVRSYALTTTFVTARVLTAIPAIDRAGESISVPAQWSLLVGTMLVTEIGLAWRSVFAQRSVDRDAMPNKALEPSAQ